MTLKERVINNLSEYDCVKKYFGNAIRKRLEIRGYTRGMLTAHLLDGESSKKDLERLEHVLRLGEKQCTDFKHIFKERNLPNKDLAIDGEIINTLAEVKAFEVLSSNHFEAVKKIKPKQTKTVDFTANKEGQNYAIEVIRLGLSQSKKKEPEYLIKIENTRFSIRMISGQDNIPVFRNTIRYSIQNKYPQIKEFCNCQKGEWKGILLVSIGRDYFIMNKYANNLFNLTPQSTLQALKLEWESYQQKRDKYNYLRHLIITIGKYPDKVIIYPAL